MKNRYIYWRKYKDHCTQDNDASVPFKVGTLGPHTVLPIAISCPVVFSWISLMVWNLCPFKGDFSLGKSRTSQGAKSGLWWGCHLGDLMFHQKVLHKTWCMSGALSWWSCQPPVAHSCSLLTHPDSSVEECRTVQAWCNIWCRLVALLAQSFWVRQPHSAHAHSTLSTTPTDPTD